VRSISIGAIIIGAVAGVLVAALVSLIVWSSLLLTTIDNPEDPALMAGVVVGFLVSGYAAGRMTRPSASHGMLAGLVMAIIVGAASIASGSPAAPITIVILVLLAAALGRSAGSYAGRQ
jgi:hypothetical protein